MNQLTLYRFALSGHCHRVELLLSLLGIDADKIDVNLRAGEHKQSEFLRKNAFAEVPVLEDGDNIIADSNAIMVYLATRYDPARYWLPREARPAAEVQRFLSVAAGPLVTGPAAARLVTVFKAGLNAAQAIEAAHRLLTVLDSHLSERAWLAAEHPTIADIANYTYIAHAPEGNVCLDGYPFLKRWLLRVESLPGFIPMPRTAAGLWGE